MQIDKKSRFWRAGLCSVALLAQLGMIGCSSRSLQPSREVPFSEQQDRGPDRDIDVSNLPDAIPRRELVRLAGNKTPYTVLGKTYHVNFESSGYSEVGYASWYGKKFHGRHTSNGEIYDMFGMTAAHKTLPIPSYVRVTNLNNQKTIVVRVNDRGPFHDGRIIDLSYAAAKRLDFHQQGTARVRVDIIEAVEPALAGDGERISGIQLADNTYLQAGAFSRKEGALALQKRIKGLTQFGTRIHSESNRQLHKVLIGPVVYQDDLLHLRRVLLDADLGESYVVEL